MSHQQHSVITAQVHHDLTVRARMGIVMYLIVWLMLVFWGHIHEKTPDAFWLNTILFAAVALLRIIHYIKHIRHPSEQIKIMYRWLSGLILFSGLHWGFMTAWLVLTPEYEILYYPSITIMVAFAMGGTATLSISPLIRKYYSIVLLAPTVLILTASGTATLEHLILSLMGILAVIYILIASNASSKDYYSAIQNHELAIERAAELEKMAHTDSMTGLPNRRILEQHLDQLIQESQQNDRQFAFIYIDVDDFKSINDELSHDAGDIALKNLADLFKKTKRESDFFARLGGDEFCLVVSDFQTKQELEKIATRLIEETAPNVEVDGIKLGLSISVGIAIFPENGKGFRELRTESDLAMYKVKHSQKGSFAFAS